VLQGDREEITQLTGLLSTRGWCFIKFEEKAKKSFDDLFSAASSFLASSEQSRERFLYEKSFGKMRFELYY
jgi:hypothetical protein